MSGCPRSSPRNIGSLPAETRHLLLVLSAAGLDADAAAEACRRLGDHTGCRQARSGGLYPLHPAPAGLPPSAHPIRRLRQRRNRSPEPRPRRPRPGRRRPGIRRRGCMAPRLCQHRARRERRSAAGTDRRAGRGTGRLRSITGTSGYARRLLSAAHAHVITGDGVQAEHLLNGRNPAGTLGARIAAERIMANDFRTGLEVSTLAKAATGLPSEELDLA